MKSFAPRNSMPRGCCVSLLLAAYCRLVSSAFAEPPEPVLQQAQAKLTPVLAELVPKPAIEHDPPYSLVVRFRPQKFLVRGHSMAGEWFTNVVEEIRPSITGSVLTVQVQPRGYENQTVTPQTLQEPYWRTLLDVTPLARTINQIYWAHSNGHGTDEKLRKQLKRAPGSWGGDQIQRR